MPNNVGHPKITGRKLCSFHGLTIYAELKMPRRKGKARVQIHVRQDSGHDWHVEQCLNYGRSLYVLWASDTTRNNEGLITLC